MVGMNCQGTLVHPLSWCLVISVQHSTLRKGENSESGMVKIGVVILKVITMGHPVCMCIST